MNIADGERKKESREEKMRKKEGLLGKRGRKENYNHYLNQRNFFIFKGNDCVFFNASNIKCYISQFIRGASTNRYKNKNLAINLV